MKEVKWWADKKTGEQPAAEKQAEVTIPPPPKTVEEPGSISTIVYENVDGTLKEPAKPTIIIYKE